MTWKKYFTQPSNVVPLRNGTPDVGFKNYSSILPEVYSGHPNRIERYVQYDGMDQDSEVNSALDILAEFCTQTNTESGIAFKVHYHEDATDTEVDLLQSQLRHWYNLQGFERKIFKLFRNVLKYGDQLFIRDPETKKWHFVDSAKVEKIVVDESAGREIEQYTIRDIAVNFETLAVTEKDTTGSTIPNLTNRQGSPTSQTMADSAKYSYGKKSVAVDAKHIVHISMTEEMDGSWPFGNSILENIFKTYKQKELLEDAIIIYRVQRAPERRVFYIDVGNMPSHMAMGFVERVKNEIHQRRIPTTTGGGTKMMDSTYNPLSIMEDYFFPQTGEGRGSKVETLPGGENLGQIDDLKFFTNKMYRALRIPSSYLPSGPDEGVAGYTDGRVGTALIQEYRFNEYCKRLQTIIASVVDDEFKLFIKSRGINIDNSIFEIKFNEPQNFASYRQAELDNTKISAFAQLEQLPYLSKRFMMVRYLGLTEEELLQNTTMWQEETGNSPSANIEGSDMRSIGITPGGLESDMGMAEMPELPMEEGMDGMEGEAGMTPGAPEVAPTEPTPV
jgi:hypothetical protein